MSRAELGAETNIEPTGGTFSTYLSLLKGAKLVIEEHGQLRLSEDLFPEG